MQQNLVTAQWWLKGPVADFTHRQKESKENKKMTLPCGPLTWGSACVLMTTQWHMMTSRYNSKSQSFQGHGYPVHKMLLESLPWLKTSVFLLQKLIVKQKRRM